MTKSLLERFTHMSDVHQNKYYQKAMQDIGWIVVGNPGSHLYIKKIGLFGIAKIQRPNHLNLSWLKQICQKHHLLTTYIEPGLSSQTEIPGIKTDPFANSATSLIDLALTEQELLKSFKQKTRYNIKHAELNSGLTIVSKKFKDLTDNDHLIFTDSQKSWSKRKGLVGYEEKFISSLLKHFADSGWLHFAYLESTCVATLMIIKNEKSAIYYSAFSEKLGYKLFAPTLLTWTAIKTAKQAGCTVFDFGGIYDERYKKMYKKWVGFTKFKEGFSPTKVLYPPTKLQLGW